MELLGRCIDAFPCKDGFLNLQDSARVGLVTSKQFISPAVGRMLSIDDTFESWHEAVFDCRREYLADDVVDGLPEPSEDLAMARGPPASSCICIRSCSSGEKCWWRILSGSDR